MSTVSHHEDLRGRVLAAGLEAGLAKVGVASAEPFDEVRATIEARAAAGLSAGMAFTYRNPARSTDPRRILDTARTLVVGALAYDRPPPARPAGPQGRVARYARRDDYADLRRGLDAVAEVLRRDGFVARVVADDNALVDRAAGTRAGLGWWGKNTNVLLPGQGSWFVLGSVVTDADLTPDEPVADGCGSCDRCLPACPTKAIVAPGVLDARRCLAWLLQDTGVFPLEYRAALGDRIYGCDECQEVCPPNRVAVRRTAGSPPVDAPQDVVAWVDVVSMLALDDAGIVAHVGRWYVPDRQARYLRRNALIVLGNTGDPGDERVAEALRSALGHPDPIVRAHAVWAATRCGRQDLVVGAGSASDSDPLVAAEVAAVKAGLVEVRA